MKLPTNKSEIIPYITDNYVPIGLGFIVGIVLGWGAC